MAKPRRSAFMGVTVLVALTVAFALWVVPAWNRYQEWRDEPSERCFAYLDGTAYGFNPSQSDYAALIGAVSAQLDLPPRAGTIGIATAIQESSLRNLDWGDRDSLGLFQQRPSQGWGTEAEIQDPYYSTKTFYAALVKVRDWQDMSVNDAAQKVQRSGFPEAYADHELEARAWANALRGYGGVDAIHCRVSGEAPVTAPEVYLERLSADWGDARYSYTVVGSTTETTTLEITPVSGDNRDVQALSTWSVAVANATGVQAVESSGRTWIRSSGWSDGEVASDQSVRVTIKTA